MKSTNYSKKVIEHFRSPRNVGTLTGDNVAVGRVGNPVCGDLMDIYIKVEDNIITDIKFKTFGCGSAVATSSMITEMVKGKSLEYALRVTRKDVAEELDGLPPIKMHCSNLAAEALHTAIKNYKDGQRVGVEAPEPPQNIIKGCESLDESHEPQIKGLNDYFGNGVYFDLKNLSELEGKRVLIVDRGDESIKKAIELTKHTGRVVFVTYKKKISSIDPGLKNEILTSDVKILYESDVLEVGGEGEVEKVKILNLDEDERYDLFVDALVVLVVTP